MELLAACTNRRDAMMQPHNEALIMQDLGKFLQVEPNTSEMHQLRCLHMTDQRNRCVCRECGLAVSHASLPCAPGAWDGAETMPPSDGVGTPHTHRLWHTQVQEYYKSARDL
jgi:hypothetical protein